MTRPAGTAMTSLGPPGLLSVQGLAAEHGFTTRSGGVSSGAYGTLNLGLSSGDERAVVERNRDLLLAHLGFSRQRVCAFNQVHGARVLMGRATWFDEDADAAVSADPDLLLVVSAADCFPVLFHDPVSGAVGAAHCGWRGTALRLAAEVVTTMRREFGSDPADLRVAVGPGIRGDCYQVSRDVVDEFRRAGFPESVAEPSGSGFLLDLEAAIERSLLAAGVEAANVEFLRRCTHCEPDEFYSHRRDAGRTGRSWGFVRATGGSRPAADPDASVGARGERDGVDGRVGD